LAKPSSEVLEELRCRGDEIYAEFFSERTVEKTGGACDRLIGRFDPER